MLGRRAEVNVAMDDELVAEAAGAGRIVMAVSRTGATWLLDQGAISSRLSPAQGAGFQNHRQPQREAHVGRSACRVC